MGEKEINIKYQVYKEPKELSDIYRHLLTMAKQTLTTAYAPYSHFYVGAAVLLRDGNIITGSNQENAAFGQCLCAEQNALAHAGSNFPNQKIKAIAVAAFHKGKTMAYPVSPCGACRQVLREHEERHNHSIEILLQGEKGPIYHFKSAIDLLPLSFSRNDIL